MNQTIAGPLKGHNTSVTSVVFSSDGKRVASGSDNGAIHIWDPNTCQIIAGPFEGHTESITAVVFSPDGQWIASGSDDCTVCIWDVANGKDFSEVSAHHNAHFQKVLSIGGTHTLRHCSGGWVNSQYDTSHGAHLFWVPIPCREMLCGLETLVLGKRSTQLDLSQFVHGKSWTKCYSPSLSS
jgi:WD40 repeat protein